MISTVTTTTVTIVSDVTLAGTVGVVAILGLLGYLIVRYVAREVDHPVAQSLSRGLSLAIVPLFLVFGVIIVDRICTALGAG